MTNNVVALSAIKFEPQSNDLFRRIFSEGYCNSVIPWSLSSIALWKGIIRYHWVINSVSLLSCLPESDIYEGGVQRYTKITAVRRQSTSYSRPEPSGNAQRRWTNISNEWSRSALPASTQLSKYPLKKKRSRPRHNNCDRNPILSEYLYLWL